MGWREALRTVVALGVEAIELPVHAGNPWFELDELLAGGTRRLAHEIRDLGLTLSAVSNHPEGQLLLGPHHRDTDRIHPGEPREKSAWAEERLRKTAQLASDLEVGIVVGFLGCEDFARFFPWPDPEGWEGMVPGFRERVTPLLDEFARLGVRFAQEPHPKQFVYNIETALESVEILGGHANWGFNLDPGNLLLAGVDPVVFIRELPSRILHVHAKDGELVAHNAGRSGLLARGAWDRPDRGFRFRVPGWGDVSWKRVVSELVLADYDGYLAVENEDPIFDPIDGLRKGLAELKPLLPVGKRKEPWW